MNKKSKSIFLILSALAISACSTPTIEEERTIILEVDSEVTPNFSSNYGNGSYDESTGKYTHKINSIKDVYITLSYEDLKSITVYIPTSEMNSPTITKTVDFGVELDAEVEIAVEGVKTLEGIVFEDNPNISNLKLGKKNTFTFNIPSREHDEIIKFTLPGYKKFEINIDKEDLITGIAKLSQVALRMDQVYVAIDGVELSYEIYSMSTNELVASGRKYSYENKSREYILLNNDDSYYMNVIYHYNGTSNLYKINKNENFILEGKNIRNDYGYLELTLNGEYYYRPSYLYDKVNKIITNGSSMTNKINSLGVITKNEQDEWVYIDNLVTNNLGNDTYNHYYEIDYSASIPIEFNVTRIHSFTNEIISSGIENDFNIYENSIISVELEGSTFNISVYENEIDMLSIDLYDSEENVIHTITHPINQTFSTSIINGTFTYQGRKVPYRVPLFKEDIVYNDGTYSYIGKPIVDTTVSLVEIVYIDKNINEGHLSDSAYLTGPDGIPILKTDIGDWKTYFELEVNVTYTLHNYAKQYEFTLTDKDIANGVVIIWDTSIKYAQVKVPNGYHILIQNDIKLLPNDNNIVNVPVDYENYENRICLSNGLVTVCIDQPLEENQYAELGAFYTFGLNNAFVEEILNVQTFNGYDDNGIIYYYFKGLYPSMIINTHMFNSADEQIIFNTDDFTYNEDLNAYYYSIEDTSNYIVNWDYRLGYNKVKWFQIDQYIYITEGNIITYRDIDYDLSTYGSKKLNITVVDDGYTSSIEITPME